jgi:hypothetical protein
MVVLTWEILGHVPLPLVGQEIVSVERVTALRHLVVRGCLRHVPADTDLIPVPDYPWPGDVHEALPGRGIDEVHRGGLDADPYLSRRRAER